MFLMSVIRLEVDRVVLNFPVFRGHLGLGASGSYGVLRDLLHNQ